VKVFAGCVCVAWFFYSSIRIETASQQTQLWNTPLYEKPAEQRTKAYREPFTALYVSWTPSARTGVLHQNEVEYLYKKYLAEFCQKLLAEAPSTDQEKRAWMETFSILNPLSPAMMQFGLGKITPAFEEMGKEYDRLFSEPITHSMLHTKFTAFTQFIGPIGPIGRTGCYRPASYLYELEGLVIEYEKKIERLDNTYLYKRENLKSRYGERLAGIGLRASPLELQTLNDQFEYDLKLLKDPTIAQAEKLKTTYLKSLQELKHVWLDPEPHSMEDRMELRWHRLQAIFREDSSSIPNEEQYEPARNLLECVNKELNHEAGVSHWDIL
jgi:hypothetical protein